MPAALTVLSSSNKLQQVADLLDQASRLLREMGQAHSDQAYFWSDEWQAGERAVDEALKNGDYQDFQNVEDALAHLHQV
jgi:hypothetical protein